MNIDFKLLHKIFRWNVLLMIVVVVSQILIHGGTDYYAILIPFPNTLLMYPLEKKYKLFGFETK